MAREDISNIVDFEDAFRVNELQAKDINVELTIPYASARLEQMQYRGTSIEFHDCHFNNKIEFRDCEPTKLGTSDRILRHSLEFIDCHFYDEVNGEDVSLDCKVRFRNCHFHSNVNFRNTKFKDLADFWRCTFHKPTTFYKTDFFDTVVFSSSTFKENVLFTYSLVEKLMILRGTVPKKGFDISLAIISGELSVFDFKFEDYKSYGKIYHDAFIKSRKEKILFDEAYEIYYENSVTSEHRIPIENKRETFRILKHQLESKKNFIDSIPYRVMENKTYWKESLRKLFGGHSIIRPISILFVLTLNAISNWFGSSYIMGALFTIFVGAFFFNLTLNHIGNFEFTWDYELWQWDYYVQFLNPTHRFDYMKAVDPFPEKLFYILDFIGRIFVGYGIYQTIQAFRKYK